MFLHLLRKGSLKTFFFSVAVLIFFFYSLGSSLRNLLRYNSFKQELVISEQSLKEHEMLNRQFQEQIEWMKTDEFWVLEAKKKLGYILSEEYVYKFYSSEGN